MSPVKKDKIIKSKEAKARYAITEAARLERIEVRRSGLWSENAQLECNFADKAIDNSVQEMINSDHRKMIEIKEKELQELKDLQKQRLQQRTVIYFFDSTKIYV